jgi:hypothetical protein
MAAVRVTGAHDSGGVVDVPHQVRIERSTADRT